VQPIARNTLRGGGLHPPYGSCRRLERPSRTRCWSRPRNQSACRNGPGSTRLRHGIRDQTWLLAVIDSARLSVCFRISAAGKRTLWPWPGRTHSKRWAANRRAGRRLLRNGREVHTEEFFLLLATGSGLVLITLEQSQLFRSRRTLWQFDRWLHTRLFAKAEGGRRRPGPARGDRRLRRWRERGIEWRLHGSL
jgi:hypothetical protein